MVHSHDCLQHHYNTDLTKVVYLKYSYLSIFNGFFLCTHFLPVFLGWGGGGGGGERVVMSRDKITEFPL